MALGGLAPVLIFTFFKQINTPAFLGIPSVKIPLLPIPVYLDEKLTGVTVDDYNRTVSIDLQRDGVTSFEKINGDVIQLRFTAKKDNIVITALSALFDRILQLVKVSSVPNYSLTLFYDNIFVLDASLEQFQTSIREGTDLREINVVLWGRPKLEAAATSQPVGRIAGAINGIL